LFGKIAEPFNSPRENPYYEVKYVAKTKTFKMKQLAYSQLAEKFDEYKDNGRFKAAEESVEMTAHLNFHT